MDTLIYFDHAATTQTDPKVLEAMLPYFSEYYGNPSSVYKFSGRCKDAIMEARTIIANSLNALPEEIYFTAGGSEADNWALKQAASKNKHLGKHIITTCIEHHGIIHTAEYLEEQGFEVTYLPVDENGIVRVEDLRRAIRTDTILISVMYANNEIGTLQPIDEIGEIAKEKNIYFHTDAVQAFGQIPIDVRKSNIDMLSASAHKLNGPKGIGFLYVNSNVKLGSFIHGGAQERGKRAGTENVPEIVGFGMAVRLALETMNERIKQEIQQRDYLIKRVLSEINFSRLNGHEKLRLPGNVNFSFQFIEGESLLIMLDMIGVCASSGSACTAGSNEPSHVLTALGLPDELARGSLRITLGEENTKEEIDYLVNNLKRIIARLRSMSPRYDDYIQRR